MKVPFIQTITKSEKIIIQKCVVFVNKHPGFKKIAMWFMRFSPKFRQRLISKLINGPADNELSVNSSEHTIELNELTEDARAIYRELQSTIEHQIKSN